MSFLFTRNKPKTLPEVVYALNKAVLRLGPAQSADQRPQATEEACRLLSHLHQAIWGTDEDVSPGAGNVSVEQAGTTDDTNAIELRKAAAEPDQIAALAKEVYATNAILNMLPVLSQLDFDARRDVANLIAFLMKRPPTIEYLLHHGPLYFETLIRLAGDAEIHRTAGNILRECAKYKQLVEFIFNLQHFWRLFSYVDDTDFEVATDNFSTLQDLLRLHPELTAPFLAKHAEYFTKCMNGLMRSPNYVAKRQSLRLQYQLIRQQRNHNYMLYYIECLDNLKLVMRLMKDKSKNIHYEAFQLFKVFVANPQKPQTIVNVLSRNKSRLLDVLDRLHGGGDRKDDEVFKDERQFILRKIALLPDVPPGGESSPDRSPSRSRSASRSDSSYMSNSRHRSPHQTPQLSPDSPQFPHLSPQRSPDRDRADRVDRPDRPDRPDRHQYPYSQYPQYSQSPVRTPDISPHRSPNRSPNRSPDRSPARSTQRPLQRQPLQSTPQMSPQTSPHRTQRALQDPRTPEMSPQTSPQASPQAFPLRAPQSPQRYTETPQLSPLQRHSPLQAELSRPSSPSRAQVPAILNLGQAPPALSQQKIPDITPLK